MQGEIAVSHSPLVLLGAVLVILGVAGFVLPNVTAQETTDHARLSAGLYLKK